MKDMNFIPYVGVGPIRFDMKPPDVELAVGVPSSTSTSSRGEFEEHRGDITVRYDSETNGVVEISFGSESGLTLDKQDLYCSSNLTKYLLCKDSSPVECFGFLLFLDIGLAATGFHDDDEDRRAISIFQKGRWDSMKENFTSISLQRCSNIAKGAKRGPKTDPNAPHNKKIREIGDQIENDDGTVIAGGGRLKERLIPKPGGYKSGRRPDVLYKDCNGNICGVNVGKTKANGSPIKREQQALDDLNGAGLPAIFQGYDQDIV